MVKASLVQAIPASVRQQLDQELRRTAFDRLHQEVVAAGTLPPAPRPWFEGPLGWLLRALLWLAAGGALGVLAMAAALFLLIKLPILT